MPSDAIIGTIRRDLLFIEIYKMVPLPDGSFEIDYRTGAVSKAQVEVMYLSPINQVRGEQVDVKLKGLLLNMMFNVAYDLNGNNPSQQYISIDGRNAPRDIADLLNDWRAN